MYILVHELDSSKLFVERIRIPAISTNTRFNFWFTFTFSRVCGLYWVIVSFTLLPHFSSFLFVFYTCFQYILLRIETVILLLIFGSLIIVHFKISYLYSAVTRFTSRMTHSLQPWHIKRFEPYQILKYSYKKIFLSLWYLILHYY